MRNLKRVLSLALACVMVIGMMVMTTGAVDFDDAAEINYTEAVDVMSALGILEGYDGNFNPDGILTREQAAKIICYMLMSPANAEMLNSTSNFADVEADRWSAPYIAYCASLGIISGYNGNFEPAGELTGVAFAKLLLVALGYDAEIEGYVGNNWATNIGTDAIEAGINIAGVFKYYNFGYHDAHIFPEFTIGKYIADYLLVGKASGGYEFVFVELEHPNSRTTLKSGHEGEAFRKGTYQIYDWIAEIEANFSASLATIIKYSDKPSLPKEFSEYDSSRFHYAVVAGLREDYNETTYRNRRNKETQQKMK